MDGERSQIKLCIRNISMETNESDIKDMVEKYGDVKYFKHLPDRNIAFVEYDNPSQAEAAKSKIHAENQMGWRIDFAIQKNKRDSVNTRLDKGFEKRDNNRDDDNRGRKFDKEMQKPERGNRFKMFEAMRTEPNATDDQDNENDEQKKEVPERDRENEEPKNQISEFKDLKMEKMTELNGSEASKETIVADKPKELAVQNGTSVLDNDDSTANTCNFCDKPAFGKCERCGDHYCSVKCQSKDWQRHRHICIPMPRLLIKRNSGSRLSLASIKSGIENLTTNIVNNVAEVEKRNISDVKLNESVQTKTIDKPNGPAHNNVNTNLSPSPRQSLAKQTIDEKKPMQSLKLEPPKPVTFTVKMIKTVEMKNDSHVAITYARDHKTAFVRPSDPDSTKQYYGVIEKVLKISETAKFLDGSPERDNLVLAPLAGGYYRALVLQVSSDVAVKVAFLDFGNMVEVPIAEIKISNDECLLGPRFTRRIVLKNILVDKSSDKIGQYLDQLTDEGKDLIMKTDDDMSSRDAKFELFDAVTKESINEKINELGGKTETKKQAPKGEPIVQASEIVTKKLEGRNLRLFVLENDALDSGFFVCIDDADQKVFADNEGKLIEYQQKIQSSAPHTPVSGEVCFVYVPDDGGYWCRAECKDVQDDKNYSMYLIDYMKEITCDVKRIRKLTKEFSYPSVSARCLVNGIGNNIKNKAVVDLLKTEIPSYNNILVDTVEYDNEKGYSICSISSIVNALKSDGLL